jgi:hypothetical protein
VIQNLTELPLIPELLQVPQWTGCMHRQVLSSDHLAAILAVAEHPRILVELASDPASPVRSHAAAVASYLQIEAVIPALLSLLDSPLPASPWQASTATDKSAVRASANAYAEAVAAWRVAIVGLASFDRRELFPRLTGILFAPPDWFKAPRQPDLGRDRDEVRHAREAVYRMLVRGGGPADWEALKQFEAQALVSQAPGAAAMAASPHAAVVETLSRFLAGIQGKPQAELTLGNVDQIAIRGERARARVDIGKGRSEVFRYSLRRQDGIWRVDDYWPSSME